MLYTNCKPAESMYHSLDITLSPSDPTCACCSRRHLRKHYAVAPKADTSLPVAMREHAAVIWCSNGLWNSKGVTGTVTDLILSGILVSLYTAKAQRSTSTLFT
jgi:hypothetical protein